MKLGISLGYATMAYNVENEEQPREQQCNREYTDE